MKTEESINDLYNKLGILVFSLISLFIGLFFKYTENIYSELLYLIPFIVTYFGFVYLFGFFFEIYIKKIKKFSSTITKKMYKYFLFLKEKKPYLFKSILIVIILFPLIILIYYMGGFEKLFDIFIGPIILYLSVELYKNIKKN